MWRKRGRVSAMGHLAACFRRTWEIKAINICSLSAVLISPSTVPCPLSNVHCPSVRLSLCPLCPLCDLQVVAHAPFPLPEVSPETLPLPPTEVARILWKRAHKSHDLTLVQKVVSLWPPAPVATGSFGLKVQTGWVRFAFLVYKHHYALFPPRHII